MTGITGVVMSSKTALEKSRGRMYPATSSGTKALRVTYGRYRAKYGSSRSTPSVAVVVSSPVRSPPA